MRLAILGGSFNPIHLGHLFLVGEVLAALHYDRIVLVPAYRSPFKLSAEGMESTAHDRLEMIAASIAGDPHLTVDDCEIKRGGISYTVDTIKDIINRYVPVGKPGLIIGNDLAADFLKWHKSGEILELADIIIARRVHSDMPDLSFPVTKISNDIMDISSGMIRSRIASGKAWRYLVPSAARAVIEERKLYNFVSRPEDADESRQHIILRIEKAARKELNAERFIHSRNTALLAWDLCKRFNVDPSLGYLAGVAHDLGKQLKDHALLSLAETDGRGISKLEMKKPALLHGRAAAVLLRQRFDIHDDDVIEAVALHTEGGEGMCPLAKIIYIADKLEVSRENVDFELREMCYTEENLDIIFSAVLNHTISWLRSKKIDLAGETLRLLDKMNSSTEKGQGV